MAAEETPEQKIKRLEQENRDLRDINYLKEEMLKEVDRMEGTDYLKKYLSAVRDLRKRQGR